MIRFHRIPVFAICCALGAQAPGPDPSHLSLQDAIQIALRNNLQVDMAQQARIQTASGTLVNEGLFDWNLAASLQVARLDLGSTSLVAPGLPLESYRETAYNRGGAAGGPLVDVNKNFIWGGSVDLNYSSTYNAYRYALVDSSGNPIPGTMGNNPVPYTGTFTATYTQNLLQGFGRTVASAPLVIAQKNAKGADYTFQAAMINLVSSTENAYWNLVYAQRYRECKQNALDLAQKLLDENTLRLQIGTMARLDVISAKAGMAQAKQDIIAAQAQLDNAKDALIRALYPNADRPATAVVASDAPTLDHIRLGEADAIKMALDRRVELKNAQVSRDVAQLQKLVADDKVRPTLSAFAQYDGNANTYSALGPVNGDLGSARYPGYTLGLKFAMPIQNRAAKGNQSSARANLRSSELSVRDQQLNVILQVRTAVRNVAAAEEGVKAAEETRSFQQQTLEAEQTKFKNGISTNFIVLQDMTNLDNARIAEVQAQINYANAVTAMEQAVGNLLEARHLEIK
jgi:outer membrane protein TolC